MIERALKNPKIKRSKKVSNLLLKRPWMTVLVEGKIGNSGFFKIFFEVGLRNLI